MIRDGKYQDVARRQWSACLLSFGLLCLLCAVAATTTAGSPASAPQSRRLRDIAAVSDKDVWAVCEDGWLLHTIDGGSSWEWRRTPADAPLRAIAFIDAQRGFVVGGRGLLLATGEGGQRRVSDVIVVCRN